jgi:SAM-dependent methyltransferase
VGIGIKIIKMTIDLGYYSSMGLVNLPCNLCGGTRTELLSNSERFGTKAKTVICSDCGLIYLNPRWSEEAYLEFYKKDYRCLMESPKESLKEVMLRQRIHGSKILEFCSDFLDNNSTVLDIGCSCGGCLWVFQKSRGCNVVGIEPSIEHSNFSRNNLCLDVRTGSFDMVSLEYGSYDLILLTQTLNHMLDPKGVLQKIHKLLKPTGLLFIEVQNFPEYAKMVKNPIQVDHTYYFCPETLECILRITGFEPLKVEVDTAIKARSVHPYMWHRSASIHMRMLAQCSDPEIYLNYPDSQKIRDEVLQTMQEHLSPPGSNSKTLSILRSCLKFPH